jgi:hypothetical protein
MTIAADTRVCPHCGEPPGGVFCASCGRNLASVERLPTRAEWEVAEVADVDDDRPMADRCAEATAAFLAAMHAAGDPGTQKTAVSGSGWRRRRLDGWIVRAVERDDNLPPKRYEPGLVLSVEGAFHQLDNKVRGYGTRDFPAYEHTVGPDPVAMPVEARLIAELAAVLAANGLEPVA